ncbi:unnamed protein product [Knipowitschia caucasica]|uniref:USP domain-containing protein n=1 Tax=Knipowitschia caucasica TaxID=637954 RepID=A0AAV2KLA2_KNICA
MGKADSNKEPKTPHGLYNQGATCYLNSILQLLFMTPNFYERLSSNRKRDLELKALFDSLKQGPCRTDNLTKHFHINDVSTQHDASQYLELILKRISPSASEMFRGELFHSIKCVKGHCINEDTDPFIVLPLPIIDPVNGLYSVETGLERIFETRMYMGENRAYCEDCGRNTEAEHKCEMKVHPQVLIILLKRFVLHHSSKGHIKSNCAVSIPATLDMKGMQYDLYGIVHHWGHLKSGHYTATVLSRNDKTWYQFNDDRVQKADEQLSGHTSSQTAYLLAYTGEQKQVVKTALSEPKRPLPATPPCRIKTALLVGCSVFVAVLFIALVLGLSLGLTK